MWERSASLYSVTWYQIWDLWIPKLSIVQWIILKVYTDYLLSKAQHPWKTLIGTLHFNLIQHPIFLNNINTMRTFQYYNSICAFCIAELRDLHVPSTFAVNVSAYLNCRYFRSNPFVNQWETRALHTARVGEPISERQGRSTLH